MQKTVWGVVRKGKIELLEPLSLAEGTKLLVTLLSEEDEGQFWEDVSSYSIREIWENQEDDIYAELLQE